MKWISHDADLADDTGTTTVGRVARLCPAGDSVRLRWCLSLGDQYRTQGRGYHKEDRRRGMSNELVVDAGVDMGAETEYTDDGVGSAAGSGVCRCSIASGSGACSVGGLR